MSLMLDHDDKDGPEGRPYVGVHGRRSITSRTRSLYKPVVSCPIAPPLDPLPVQGGDGCWVRCQLSVLSRQVLGVMTSLLSLRGANATTQSMQLSLQSIARSYTPQAPETCEAEHRLHGSPRPPSRRARDDNTVCHCEERTRRRSP